MPKYDKCCFVYGCFSTSKQSPKLGFHKFPPKYENNFLRTTKYGIKQVVNRRQLWMEALNIGRGASYTVDEVKVCSLHFSKADFYQLESSTNWYLKKNAVPRRNLPTRWSSPLTTRFSIRSLNRIKYRGYFNIHNPDGRKLTVKRKYLGENYKKATTNSSSYQKTVWVARKPAPVITENDTKDNDDDSNWKGAEILNAHSLADKSEFEVDKNDNSSDPNTISEHHEEYIDDDDDDVTYTGEQQSSEAPWSPSQVIIKEEQISEDEEGYPTDVKASSSREQVLHEISTYEESTKEVDLMEEQNDPVELNEEIDLNEEMEVNEEGVTESNEEMEGDNYEYGIECKICGEENCEGHPGSRPKEHFFVCLVCTEVFTSKKELSLHSRIHKDTSAEELLADQRVKDLSCHICGRTLATRATLREHVMIHTGEKPYTCLLCGKSFRHKANLVVHVNAHTVVNSYNCPECSESFSKRLDLEKHIRGHLYNEFICTICNSKFKSQRTLYNHSMLHTKKGQVRKKRSAKAKGGKLHMCKVCGKILSTSATLKEHMLIHSGEKPHVCLLCGKTVRHKANFVVHVQSHSRGQSFECNICEDAFLKKSDLRQHRQLMHSQVKLYTCPICGLSFKTMEKFNVHAETHTEEEVNQVNEEVEEEEHYDYDVMQPHLLEAFLTES